ncbi:MAG: DUF503 domain-containing protein [Candidatus Poribacteria bacterium]|nr:DUF503 domain-containing protein [Candidatus Poribacteria bacterium]MDE0481410.1 DUF503 domain-containing protein [Candidatus Poribacteria bacterium]
MHIGVCKIKLYLPESQSLKEKRRVIKSIIARLKNRFNVAIAEIEAQDVHQSAVLGAVTVANEVKFVDKILAQCVKFIEENSSVVLIDYETEFFF